MATIPEHECQQLSWWKILWSRLGIRTVLWNGRLRNAPFFPSDFRTFFHICGRKGPLWVLWQQLSIFHCCVKLSEFLEDLLTRLPGFPEFRDFLDILVRFRASRAPGKFFGFPFLRHALWEYYALCVGGSKLFVASKTAGNTQDIHVESEMFLKLFQFWIRGVLAPVATG